MEHPDREWLGEDMIQRNGDRITVPPEVVDREIATPGEPLFWAEDDEGVVVSKRREFFADADRFRLLGESDLDGDRETSIPPEITDRDGFGAGDILHFVASDGLSAEGACRVMTEDASEQFRS